MKTSDWLVPRLSSSALLQVIAKFAKMAKSTFPLYHYELDLVQNFTLKINNKVLNRNISKSVSEH